MRSMWRGAISFGLVMIPVRLYAATEQRDVAFRQVHKTDGGRIKFRRVCSVCGEEVPFSDVAKGYELPDGEMVVLTDEDFADLPLPTARSIEVVNFTPEDQLDPLLWGRSYYAEPEPAGLRAYALLRDALADSGKIGIARVALRQRESLAAVRAQNGMLVLGTLLWPDEVREPDFGFLDQQVEVRSQELTMASSLIDSMTVDFDPSQYHDHYREAVEELVAAKTEGQEVVKPAPREGEEAVTSLAEALRASLEASRSASPDGGRQAADGDRQRRRAGDGGRGGGGDGRSTEDGGARRRASTDGRRRAGNARDKAESEEPAASGGESRAGGASGRSRSRRPSGGGAAGERGGKDDAGSARKPASRRKASA